MLKKIFLLFFITCTYSVIANSQDTTEIKKPKAEFSGFLRLDYWYDSRVNSESLDGLFIFYPLPPKLDADGVDINANHAINSLALATRLRTSITMPKVFNAKPSILVEADFTGMSTIVHMRFRHAFAKFVWNSGTELNAGLTWHPMFVTEVFPHVASLNTGAPFQSFNRSPQITLKQTLTPGLKLILSALSQSDYKSFGPEFDLNSANTKPISSVNFQRYSLVPNLHAQLQYSNKTITAGIAVDYKNQRPLLATKSYTLPVRTYSTNERIKSLSYMAYLKVQTGLLTAKFKGMLGQNLADHLMLGGYAVSTIDSLTGKQTYTPLNHIFAQANLTYGKTIMPGIFIGYAKNLGATDKVVNDVNKVYARGTDIAQLYRITPNLTYKNKSLTLIAEVEHTIAAYGTIDFTQKAKVINASNVSNTRMLLVVQYEF